MNILCKKLVILGKSKIYPKINVLFLKSFKNSLVIAHMDTTIYKVTMYYDTYEYHYGDGFYPCTLPTDACNTPIDLFFIQKLKSWYQIDTTKITELEDIKYINITGLDGNNGNLLLCILNQNANTNHDCLYNTYGLNILRPKASNRSI